MNVLEIAMLKDGALDRTQNLAKRMLSTTKDEYTLEVISALAITIAAIVKSEVKEERITMESAEKLIRDTSAYVTRMFHENI